uniref:hypothetical protein n=1 Tax=Bradyrhizobium sp. 33ap4 TaxID=3061630 RepID=UPI00292FCD07
IRRLAKEENKAVGAKEVADVAVLPLRNWGALARLRHLLDDCPQAGAKQTAKQYIRTLTPIVHLFLKGFAQTPFHTVTSSATAKCAVTTTKKIGRVAECRRKTGVDDEDRDGDDEF